MNDDTTTYRFSYSRHIGEIKVVVIDGRHGGPASENATSDDDRPILEEISTARL